MLTAPGNSRFLMAAAAGSIMERAVSWQPGRDPLSRIDGASMLADRVTSLFQQRGKGSAAHSGVVLWVLLRFCVPKGK